MTDVPPGDGGAQPPPPPPGAPPPPPPPGAYPPPGQQWAPPGYGQQPWQQSPYGGAPLGGPPRQQPQNGIGVTALVLGILALLSGWLVVGGVLGILAVIFGIIGIRKANRGEADNRGMAIGGLVTGILGIIIAVVVVVVVATSDEVDTYIECLQDAETDNDREQCGEDFADELEPD